MASRNQISLWGDENVLKLTVVIVPKLCEYTKHYWIVFLNGWIVWDMNYINKAVTKKKSSSEFDMVCKLKNDYLGTEEGKEKDEWHFFTFIMAIMSEISNNFSHW